MKSAFALIPAIVLFAPVVSAQAEAAAPKKESSVEVELTCTV